MKKRIAGVAVLGLLASLPAPTLAAGHREAPLVALDRAADVTDVFAFRSYGDGPSTTATLIMSVDAQLEPAGAPVWYPFDPDVRYELAVDNDNDALADVRFLFRFRTELVAPDAYQALLGVSGGVDAPGNSPPPIAPGTEIVPPRIDSMDDAGIALRQTYTVTMIKNGIATPLVNGDLSPFQALPANPGPRSMDHAALHAAAVYALPGGFKVFAGTTDDAFAADSGGLGDTVNTSLAPPILSAVQDAALVNPSSDSHSGASANSIAIQVPIATLTRTGAIEPASSTAATIGVWASTHRRFRTKREPAHAPATLGDFTQVQRMGNPFVNAWLVGLAERDVFSTKPPRRDDRYQAFFLDPRIARVWNALTAGAVAIPSPPRTDLLPLFTYAPPVAAPGTPAGPIADLLRLNIGVPPTTPASASRLGLLGGDAAGFPNGRRPFDDVTDVMLRLVVGGVLAGSFPGFSSALGGRLGDGVNVNDAPFPTSFPYLALAPSGRGRRHVDPGEAGCTFGVGGACLP